MKFRIDDPKWDNFDWCSIRDWVQDLVYDLPMTLHPKLPFRFWTEEQCQEFAETCEMIISLTKKAEHQWDDMIKNALRETGLSLPPGLAFLKDDKDN